jgi:hypothetical protein
MSPYSIFLYSFLPFFSLYHENHKNLESFPTHPQQGDSGDSDFKLELLQNPQAREVNKKHHNAFLRKRIFFEQFFTNISCPQSWIEQQLQQRSSEYKDEKKLK